MQPLSFKNFLPPNKIKLLSLSPSFYSYIQLLIPTNSCRDSCKILIISINTVLAICSNSSIESHISLLMWNSSPSLFMRSFVIKVNAYNLYLLPFLQNFYTSNQNIIYVNTIASSLRSFSGRNCLKIIFVLLFNLL